MSAETADDRAAEIERAMRTAALAAGVRMSGDDRVGQRDAARLLGMGFSTLERHRLQGCGPTSHRLGGRVTFRLRDLAEWVAAGRRSRAW